jgi:hypothetical protein
VDDYVHMVMQQDFTYGLITRITGNQDAGDNAIVYQQVPTLLYGDPVPVVGTKEPRIQNMVVTPNPAASAARVSFTAEKAGNVSVDVFNAMGTLVMTQHTNVASGTATIDLNTAKLNNGIHYVRLNAGYAAGTIKLMIAK